MEFASLVPERDTPKELGWLRCITNFVSAECAAGTDWARRYKVAKFKQHPDVKAYCDELRPFRYFAESLGLSDETTFILRETGHRIDLSYCVNGTQKDLQITTSFSDVTDLHPNLSGAGKNNFDAGYQRALATEVTRRDGFSSPTSLYVRNTQGRAVALEESKRMHTAEQLAAALVSGLKTSAASKMKPNYNNCDLLVWHTGYEDYYNPDYSAIVQRAWDPEFVGYFNAVHFMVDYALISFDANGRCVKS
ncbi:hypothetical protein [Henriciella litoralis]|uniref:hypothetical protein n=1 Tax=Henriciella litoralis TaxID=568102 RepID=UPI000A059A8C|nr:hypothetical protein [Henriciella litoralis]